jgi:hypothetical protein
MRVLRQNKESVMAVLEAVSILDYSLCLYLTVVSSFTIPFSIGVSTIGIPRPNHPLSPSDETASWPDSIHALPEPSLEVSPTQLDQIPSANAHIAYPQPHSAADLDRKMRKQEKCRINELWKFWRVLKKSSLGVTSKLTKRRSVWNIKLINSFERLRAWRICVSITLGGVVSGDIAGMGWSFVVVHLCLEFNVVYTLLYGGMVVYYVGNDVSVAMNGGMLTKTD